MRHNSNQSEIHPFPEGYPQEGLLEGRNALQEALRSGRTIDKVWVAAGDTDPEPGPPDQARPRSRGPW